MNVPGLTANQIEQIIAWAKTKEPISELFVFGSRARGDHRSDSDLDIAYRLSSDDPDHCEPDHARKIQWASALFSFTGLQVDLWHVYPTLDKQQWQNIERDGKLIYCKK